MTSPSAAPSIQRQPELLGQTVVVIGGSAGIGLETARRARAEGADVNLAGRNPERLEQAAIELAAQRTAAFDANDPASLQSFFQDLATPIDHVMVTAGAPHYGPPLAMTPEEARRGLTEHLLVALEVARCAAGRVRPPGSLIFMGGTGARRPRTGLAIASAASAALPALIASLALELAPIRVNCVSPGLSRTPRWNAMPDDVRQNLFELQEKRVPLRRLGTAEELALAYMYFMENTYATGNVINVDGGAALA